MLYPFSKKEGSARDIRLGYKKRDGYKTTAECHAQLYTPSYLQNGKPLPHITSAPKSVDYNVGFSVGFFNTTSLDRVVLNGLASSTQRVSL